MVKTTVVQHQRSLLRKSNPNPANNKAALISLFWASNGQRITGDLACRCFLQPDWQINNGIVTGQQWRLLKSWYTGGGPEQGLGTVSQSDLTRSLVSTFFAIANYMYNNGNNLLHALYSDI